MRTILLLIDDPNLQNLYGRMLERRSYRVLHTARAEQAHTFVSEEEIDLLIVDHALPESNPLELLSDLDGDFRRQVRIMYLAPALQASAEIFNGPAEQYGIDLVLHKPVSPIEFGIQVDDLLEVFDLDTLEEDSSAAREFDAMRQEFVSTIEDDLLSIESIFSRLTSQSSPRWIAESLERRIARLRTAAIHFGYHELAQALLRIPIALDRCASSVHSLPGSALAESAPALAQALFTEAFRDAMANARALRASAPRRHSWPLDQSPSIPRLLVIDEDPSFLAVLGNFAEQFSIDLELTRSLDEARRIMHVRCVDGIFAGLPADASPLNAAEFLRDLREAMSPTIPIALICPQGEGLDHVQGVYAGAALILERPLSPSAFYQAAHHLTSLGRAEQTHVLLVDADHDFAGLIQAMLGREGLQITHIRDANKLLDDLERVRPDALLLNPIMTGMSGFDTCRMLRTIPRWQDLPILFVSQQDGTEKRIASYQAGADDFLASPIIADDLLARLHVRLERTRLLRERADHDMLTGMLTRRAFLEQLAARLSEVSRHQRPLVFCILDIDRFKHVNDTYGHLAGDRVLMRLGELLLNRFRIEDLRARWGGEEFTIVLVGEDQTTAHRALQRVLNEFSKIDFHGDEGEVFHVTFSAGIAQFPGDGVDSETLLRAADQRLLEAKRQGRNQIRYALSC